MSDPRDLLSRYSTGQRAFDGALLEGFQLSMWTESEDEVNLCDIQLSDARMDGADLSFAVLNGASFYEASLIRASFRKTQLNGGDLRRIDGEGISMIWAKLASARFGEAELAQANFAGADLSGADFRDATLVEVNFTGAKLNGTRLNPAALEACTFADVDLSELTMTEFTDASADPCHFDFSALHRTAMSLRKGLGNLDVVARFLTAAGLPSAGVDLLRNWSRGEGLWFPVGATAADGESGVAAFDGNLASESAEAELLVAAASRDPLHDFSVGRVEGLPSKTTLLSCLADAADERPLQVFLEENPLLLARQIGGGGHGQWVLPQARLGSEFRPDFMVAARDSAGFHWTAVEIESPRARLFLKDGDPSKELRHAIRQITDWRNWLIQNRDYADRPRQLSGLGLTDVDGRLPGLILIGRRAELSDGDRGRRRQMIHDLRIDIRTYDSLLDEVSHGQPRDP